MQARTFTHDVYGVGQVELPEEIRAFIRESTGNYGKVKLVLHRNRFWVESAYPDILRALLKVWPALIGIHCPLNFLHLLWQGHPQICDIPSHAPRHAGTARCCRLC